MVESLPHDNIDTIEDDLHNEESWFNFENSLSEIKESENGPLPEWFSYDSNGYIVCENSPFVSEDYKQEPSPIEKIIWDKMAEWEYLIYRLFWYWRWFAKKIQKICLITLIFYYERTMTYFTKKK